jgi:hemoglobin
VVPEIDQPWGTEGDVAAARLAAAMQALAAPNRVRMISRLRESPCSVSDLNMHNYTCNCPAKRPHRGATPNEAMTDDRSNTGDTIHTTAPEESLYDRVGGDAYFGALVERFYMSVENDPVLRPLYPEDLGPGKANLAGFLAQYWGGPPNYSARRGHPRLRMRHFRFPIGHRERDAWVGHMVEAVRSSDASTADAEALIAYFDSAATMLINQPTPR